MTEEEWTAPWIRSLALMLNGQTLDMIDEMGQPVVDDTFLILINAHAEGVEFTLPKSPHCRGWCRVLNTADLESPFAEGDQEESIILTGRSLVLLRESRDSVQGN